jgi:tetratricopeptide (TPR) repeat protein
MAMAFPAGSPSPERTPMNLRALTLLAGTVALAGCSSGANGSSATPTPNVSTTATVIADVPSPAGQATTSTPTGKSSMRAGQAYLHLGDYRQAETVFKRVIASGKNVTAGYAGLGAAAAGLKDYSASYAAYKAALASQPRNPTFLYGAADAALNSRDYKAAVKYATRFITAEPKDIAGYHLRMLAYGRLLLPKLQLSDANTINRLKPNDPQGVNDLGIAFANNQKYRQALAAFSRAIKLQPTNYAFYQNRALVEHLTKNKRGALADVRKAISLAPDPGTKKVLTDELNQLENQS